MRAAFPLTVDNFTVVELKDGKLFCQEWIWEYLGQTKYALADNAYQYDSVKIVAQAHGITYSYPIVSF